MPRVLVVDDEPDLRFLLRRMLEGGGFEVAEAHNGAVALDRLRDETFHVVITDLSMPVMDGRDLIGRLRSDPGTASIPVVMWSAEPDRDAGADEVIAKPYGGKMVVETVRRLVERGSA